MLLIQVTGRRLWCHWSTSSSSYHLLSTSSSVTVEWSRLSQQLCPNSPPLPFLPSWPSISSVPNSSLHAGKIVNWVLTNRPRREKFDPLRTCGSIFLAPLLVGASRTYSVADWCLDGCLSSNFCQISTPPTVFARFLQQVAHVIYVPMWKHCGTDFWLKVFGEFLKFYVISGAV